jgi:hypothetical protein
MSVLPLPHAPLHQVQSAACIGVAFRCCSISNL